MQLDEQSPRPPQRGADAPVGGLWRILPGALSLTELSASSFRSDFVAGLTLAAYLLPASIGDATLAGLNPEAGLYACLFAGLVFWLLSSSRHTSITVTSAISLLIGTSLGDYAGGDPSRFTALAATTAIIVAGLAFIAWVVRAGVLVNFISETVLVGFKVGVALHLTSTQLPKLSGFSGSHGDFWERITDYLRRLPETHILSIALGLGALAILLASKLLMKNRPIALFVMVGGIAIAAAAHLDDRGVKLLGHVPSGLPAPRVPPIAWSDVIDLLPLAMACFLLGAVETVAIGRTFALKHGYRIDANQDFLALATANLAAGLGQGYPVSGGMSQSLVNESAGARSSLSGLIAAVFVLLVVLFFSGLLRDLPQPVLAAIVLTAVVGLVNSAELRRMWRFSRGEFAVAMAAMLGVLTAGILQGVLIGVVISVLMLLHRASRPHTAELGRVPGTEYFADMIRHPDNERMPGVFVFRVDGGMLYFNVDHVRSEFFRMLDARPDNMRLAVFFLGNVPIVDLAGAELLGDLHRTLNARGITLRLAEAHGGIRDALRRAGFEDQYGPVQANQTVADVLNAHH